MNNIFKAKKLICAYDNCNDDVVNCRDDKNRLCDECCVANHNCVLYWKEK